jgi:hypothetical protein
VLDVEHSSKGPATLCQSYLQYLVLWQHLKEHNMHESIRPKAVGRHACQAVTETLGLPYAAHKANLQCVTGKTLQALLVVRDVNIAFDIEAVS